MFDDPDGPIEHFGWGKYIIRGIEHSQSDDDQVLGAGKDICVKGDLVSEWRERKGHNLTRAMVHPALQDPPDILIIGLGVQGMLQCPDSVLSYLTSSGIKQVLCMLTPLACERYNQLYRQGVNVMLLAHGTC
jgi:hypothetical protein